MHHPLQTLRRVLEHELAVYGPYVPLGDPAPAEAEAAEAFSVEVEKAMLDVKAV